MAEGFSVKGFSVEELELELEELELEEAGLELEEAELELELEELSCPCSPLLNLGSTVDSFLGGEAVTIG